MALQSKFIDLPLDALRREAAVMKAEGWRFIQTHAVNTDDGVDLYYSFMRDGLVRNYRIKGVQKDMPVPSITDLFLAAFVFENEARELFGVDMRDIAIDFAGAMYAPAQSEPMTFMTPEQRAARQKARQASEAKAHVKQESEAQSAAARQAGKGFAMTEEKLQKLEARLAEMAPEKVAKVRAALAAREAEAAGNAETAQAQPADDAKAAEPAAAPRQAGASATKDVPVDELLQRKLAAMDQQKAQKVRAALGLASADDTPSAKAEAASDSPVDAIVEAKLALMDEAVAQKVRAALVASARRNASEGGE